MKFVLEGTEYTTENVTLKYVRLHKKMNGEDMVCIFTGLGSFPKIEEVRKFMESLGAKVVDE